MIVLILHVVGSRCQTELLVGVTHDRQLVCPIGADALLVSAGMRAVGDARRVEADRALVDPLAAGEIAIDIKEDLVHVDGGMAIGTGDRPLGVVYLARHKGADDKLVAREIRVNRRRQMDLSGARLVVVDVEGEGVGTTIPADDIVGEMFVQVDREHVLALDDQLVRRLAVGTRVVGQQRLGYAKVTRREGGVHGDLTIAVTVLVGDVDKPARLEDEKLRGVAVPVDAIGRAAWDENVVVLTEGKDTKERLKASAAFVGKVEFVAVAVEEKPWACLCWLAQADVDIGVEQQDTTSVEKVAGGV